MILGYYLSYRLKMQKVKEIKMRKIFFPLVFIVGVTFLLISQIFFTVDETETAIVIRLGAYQRTHTSPGLQIKTPFIESVTKFNKKLLRVDVQAASLLTSDKRNLLIDSYARYRIVDPLKFYRTLREQLLADARVGDIVNAQLRSEVALDLQEEVISEKREEIMEQVTIGSNRAEISREEALDVYGGLESSLVTIVITEKDLEGKSLRGRLATSTEINLLLFESNPDSLKDTEIDYYIPLREKYGIEIVDVRIKRADFPQDISQSVYARMEAEREKIAKGLRAEGAQRDSEIRAEVDKRVKIILDTANGQSEQIRGLAEKEAIEILAEALNKDPEFYNFRRSLEAYKLIVDSKTSLVLDPESELFQFLESSKFQD
ncbi:MAG: HflC protein [Chloroflexi bacterium]|nr:HflC protein [Chloroflexota bacterium]